MELAIKGHAARNQLPGLVVVTPPAFQLFLAIAGQAIAMYL
jgi:hypothetical protein